MDDGADCAAKRRGVYGLKQNRRFCVSSVLRLVLHMRVHNHEAKSQILRGQCAKFAFM